VRKLLIETRKRGCYSVGLPSLLCWSIMIRIVDVLQKRARQISLLCSSTLDKNVGSYDWSGSEEVSRSSALFITVSFFRTTVDKLMVIQGSLSRFHEHLHDPKKIVKNMAFFAFFFHPASKRNRACLHTYKRLLKVFANIYIVYSRFTYSCPIFSVTGWHALPFTSLVFRFRVTFPSCFQGLSLSILRVTVCLSLL